jgi:protein-disulfide isomerase
MAALGSAPLPPLGGADHVRGRDDAPLLIEYSDLECPYCAVLHGRLVPLVQSGRIRHVFRHFPVRSAHPRAWAAAAAAEAAARQGRFWAMHDLLLADQARLEDPHLWQHARTLALDLDRFDRDRRGDEVLAHVRRDFSGGVSAGVVTTPSVFFDGELVYGDALTELIARL